MKKCKEWIVSTPVDLAKYKQILYIKLHYYVRCDKYSLTYEKNDDKLSTYYYKETFLMEQQKNTLQTVDRALGLIDILANAGEMSIIEISKALGITRTGAYNLVNSLMARHYIEKDASSNKYQIGYRFLEMGATYKYRYPFVSTAQREIYGLSKKWKHQINLSIFKEPCTTVFLMQQTNGYVQNMIQRTVLPAYATASGKLQLANLPDEELHANLEKVTLEKFARQTITDKEQLLKNIALIRERGYSVETEECVNQRACIACPIRDTSGNMACSISMVMSLEDYQMGVQLCLDDLQSTAGAISMELGYNPYRHL